MMLEKILTNEEFSEFIKNRASKVRNKIAEKGYYVFYKFNQEVLKENIHFNLVQGIFLMLYFQKYSVHNIRSYLRDRKSTSLVKREKSFVDNIPYDVGSSLDDYLISNKDIKKNY